MSPPLTWALRFTEDFAADILCLGRSAVATLPVLRSITATAAALEAGLSEGGCS